MYLSLNFVNINREISIGLILCSLKIFKPQNLNFIDFVEFKSLNLNVGSGHDNTNYSYGDEYNKYKLILKRH